MKKNTRWVLHVKQQQMAAARCVAGCDGNDVHVDPIFPQKTVFLSDCGQRKALRLSTCRIYLTGFTGQTHPAPENMEVRDWVVPLRNRLSTAIKGRLK